MHKHIASSEVGTKQFHNAIFFFEISHFYMKILLLECMLRNFSYQYYFELNLTHKIIKNTYTCIYLELPKMKITGDNF